MEVAHAMGFGGDVGRAGVRRRALDAADRAPVGHVRDIRRDVRPTLAVVARHVHQAIIAPSPQYSLLLRRLSNRKNRAINLHARVVARDRPAAPALTRAIVARQIGTDLVPVSAIIMST